MTTSNLQIPENSGQDRDTKWIPANSDHFAVSGLHWFKENDGEFIRLPKRAQGVVRPEVWGLANAPSGGRIRFKTDSTSLKLRIYHGSGALCLPHMCAVGTSGIDLYEGSPEKMTFWASNYPGSINCPYICAYFENLPRQLREFTLYLPAYTPLAGLEIGLDLEAGVAEPTPFKCEKPVVFYGTSITQGGCASRSGNGFVPRVGRMLGIDAINLGFSGNGKCEPEVADLVGEIDAECFVIDCIANMTNTTMKQRYANFVSKIRSRWPETPILLMTRICFAFEHFRDGSDIDQIRDVMNAVVLETYNKMKTQGDEHVYYFDSTEAVGLSENHPTVDGVHLTDEGFRLLADALAPVLANIRQ
jgi:hypothetical protein